MGEIERIYLIAFVFRKRFFLRQEALLFVVCIFRRSWEGEDSPAAILGSCCGGCGLRMVSFFEGSVGFV